MGLAAAVRVLALCAASASVTGCAGLPVKPASDRCAAAAEILEIIVSDGTAPALSPLAPAVEDIGLQALSSRRREGGEFGGGIWDKAVPPTDLAKAFVAEPGQSAYRRCPAIRRVATRRQLRLSGGQTGLRLGMPVLSADGREALVSEEVTYGPLAGTGWILWLRRDSSGRWALVEKATRWVS